MGPDLARHESAGSSRSAVRGNKMGGGRLMRRFSNSAKYYARQTWWALRQIFGDAAYENYLQSVRRSEIHGEKVAAPLSRDEFYLDSLQRRYSKISRCC
jgi:uncharacterized short protein YbdD (DUF466 family)